MHIFQSSHWVCFVDSKNAGLNILLWDSLLCGLIVNSLLVPKLQELFLKFLHLGFEISLVVNSKLLKGILKFLDLMPEHIDSIPISPDSFLIRGCINLLHNILHGLLDIIPS